LPEEKDCFMTDSVPASADNSKPPTRTMTAGACSHQADDMMNLGDVLRIIAANVFHG
jgi:hypothetical protein